MGLWEVAEVGDVLIVRACVKGRQSASVIRGVGIKAWVWYEPTSSMRVPSITLPALSELDERSDVSLSPYINEVYFMREHSMNIQVHLTNQPLYPRV